MQHFNYSLTELEQMLPWEREVYLILLNEFIEEIEILIHNNKSYIENVILYFINIMKKQLSNIKN